VAAAAALIVGGCASSSTSHLNPTVAGQLQNDVQAVRNAAAAGDRKGAAAELDLLRQHLTQYQKAGSLSAADFTAITNDAAAVAAQLGQLTPPTVVTVAPTTTSTSTSTTTTTSEPKHKPKGHD
jgi:hypothetical protein